MTDREAFLSVCSQRAAVPGDVLVVLCGEDCQPRLEAAVAMFRMGWAPHLLLSGGVDDGNRVMGAERAKGIVMGLGVAPDRIDIERTSRHTYDQAAAVLVFAEMNEWKRLVLVASSYHMPRAALTFIAEIQRRGAAESVQVIPAYVSMAWHEPPAGGDVERIALLERELAKVDEYRERGHCASYRDGIDYLKFWEAKR